MCALLATPLIAMKGFVNSAVRGKILETPIESQRHFLWVSCSLLQAALQAATVEKADNWQERARLAEQQLRDLSREHEGSLRTLDDLRQRHDQVQRDLAALLSAPGTPHTPGVLQGQEAGVAGAPASSGGSPGGERTEEGASPASARGDKSGRASGFGFFAWGSKTPQESPTPSLPHSKSHIQAPSQVQSLSPAHLRQPRKVQSVGRWQGREAGGGVPHEMERAAQQASLAFEGGCSFKGGGGRLEGSETRGGVPHPDSETGPEWSTVGIPGARAVAELLEASRTELELVGASLRRAQEQHLTAEQAGLLRLEQLNLKVCCQRENVRI